MIPLIFTFIIVIVIIYLSYLFSKRMGTTAFGGNKSKYMKVLDRSYLGPEKYIEIIQVGNKIFLVGITSTSIQLIQELSNEDLIEINNFDKGNHEDTLNFKDVLKKLYSKDK